MYFVIPASRNQLTNAPGRERDIPAAKADSSRQPSNKHATSLRKWENRSKSRLAGALQHAPRTGKIDTCLNTSQSAIFLDRCVAVVVLSVISAGQYSTEARTMSTAFTHESAKIYTFPKRVRIKADTHGNQADSAVSLAPRANVAVGSGWYHEAAIEEAERDRKR
ncbi:DUF2735 domain-containing protein [Allomesorhizobium camelthorni]|uniref:DUF2735 domain-containing protein n=1 Tax=Allomesorhizobium camelthorni TaxID=475069 RepID=A0A6G4WE71_9HYPH|nr:DUF2735 domain-containing protein [Mesorhizobium camelthorni]NGO52407.1 DUF2735 domain-containing protein [Mesorhizobium camelthorni]